MRDFKYFCRQEERLESPEHLLTIKLPDSTITLIIEMSIGIYHALSKAAQSEIPTRPAFLAFMKWSPYQKQGAWHPAEH